MEPRAHDRFRYDGILHGAAAVPETDPDALARFTGDGALLAASRTRWTYFGSAAIHPSNLLLLIGVMFLSLILWSAPILLAGLGVEAAFLAVVPRCAFFRRSIDAGLDEADRAAAQKAREALILQMGEGHRQELARIEALLGKAVANAHRGGSPVLFYGGEPLAFCRLTSSYIRLAIAHRACEESLAMTNRHALEGTIRALEAAETQTPAASRGLLRRRLSIAYRRAECWSRTRDGLEAIGHQLATIAELVHLMHQESLAPSGSASVSADVDQVLLELEHGEGALRELCALGVVEEPVEAQDHGSAPEPLSRRA